ncbi:MAG TPA: PEP-CTERM sorting domain-containing protein, partial [Candidatus Bathyarchaeia archaeon]|nr:PEP-CTERM sorting domain-containing protein [Candidatus Bathyarchaeia archaeon]
NIPVFNFDMNQTGANPDVFINGQVRIVDTTDNSIAAFWAFDNLKNNVYDPSSMVLAMGNIDLGVDQCINPKNGHEQTCYALDNNKGSGSLDFIAFAPTMDLRPYADSKYVFLADFSIGNAAGDFGALNNGFEELYLTGAFAPSNTVPEPASILLFATGLMGWAGFRRKK